MVNSILVSQPKPTSEKSPYFDIAKKYNVKVDFHSFIKIERLTPKEFRQQKVSIPEHTAVIFNSRHAIDHFFSLCEDLRVTIPETMKYFCISETIALYIQKYVQYRKRKIFFGAKGKMEDLIPYITRHSDENYFVPMSSVHNDEVKNMLDSLGVKHDEAVMYRTVSNSFDGVDPSAYDMLVLFTPAGVTALKEVFPGYVQGDRKLACFGAAAAKAIQDAGFRLDLQAPNVNATSMTAALDLYLKEENKR